MKRAIALLALCLLSVSCATTSHRNVIWCDDRAVQNASLGEVIAPKEIFPILTDQIPSANEILSRVSFSRVDRNTFRRLTGIGSYFDEDMYYLIRSGIYSPVNATILEIKTESDRPGTRVFQYRDLDQLLTVFSFQGVRRERLFPMPILVRVSFFVEATQAYCRTHY